METSFGLLPHTDDLRNFRTTWAKRNESDEHQAARIDIQQVAQGETAHTDGSVHNNATPWSTATMGMVTDRGGHSAGLALNGSMQSIDSAELESTIVIAENGAKKVHIDSVYVVVVCRKVMRFLRGRKALTRTQLQSARSR